MRGNDPLMSMNESAQPSSGQRLVNTVRTHRLAATFVLLGTLSAGMIAGSAWTGTVHGQERAPKVDTSDATPLRVPPPTTSNNEFSRIVKMVGPAVVNINTESLPKQMNNQQRRRTRRGQQGGQQMDPGDMQDFLRRYFGGGQDGDDNDGDDEGMGGAGSSRRALGSGFIVDPRGYIITNNHVVEKADRIYVKLSTDADSEHGRPATVVGTDKDTDIAVIKIDSSSPLPTVKLGNSESASVGDWVLAIGSPFGLSQTVSAGIVSAKNRSIEPGAASQFQHFIQTDAAINPGNSGGPLVDMNGAVIGVNTAIYTQSMGSQGVGFAMPSNTVVDVYNMLIGPEHKVTRGSIGIQFQSQTTSAVSRVYGFSKGGVLITSVTPGMPAAKAGLMPQDVIVAIDDKPVRDGDDLVNNISARHPGSTVKITYLRGGKSATTTVGIADRTKVFAAIGGNDNGDDSDAPAAKENASKSKLGLEVEPVPSDIASKMGTRGGVIVTRVTPGSFGDEYGIERGDILLEINRHHIDGSDSLANEVQKLRRGDDVVFVVRKNGSRDKMDTFLGGTLQ